MAITPSFHRYSIFTSFLFLLDLKLGCTILTLFNLFNKSAGVFGLLAIFQGGTLGQLTLYAYSLGTIFISLWGLRGISEESSPTVLLYSHLYLLDHLISSLWSFYFFQLVYYQDPHDGQPPPQSPYQAGLMSLIESIESQYETKGTHHTPLEGQARFEAAQRVWKGESGFSMTVLGLGWLLKIYFALLLYSYALHLRHGTYKSLPLSRPSHSTTAQNRNGYVPVRASLSIEVEEGGGPEASEAVRRNVLAGGAGNSSRVVGGSQQQQQQPRTVEEELPGWSDDDDEDDDDDYDEGDGLGQQDMEKKKRHRRSSSGPTNPSKGTGKTINR